VAERRGSLRLLALATVSVATLAGCGDTLQSKPLRSSALEPLVTAQHYPVYWVGARFERLPLSTVSSDPSGAYAVQYGSCITGGPETCIPPLQVISSPDNSFLPGAGGQSKTVRIRGAKAVLAQGGRVVEIATGAAVIDVRASSRVLALAAAMQMVPINELGKPRAPLPAPQPNTGFAERPMEGQRPPVLQGLPSSRSR
jgi:hypothetical protein